MYIYIHKIKKVKSLERERERESHMHHIRLPQEAESFLAAVHAVKRDLI
jgi:hypothetical protein